MPNMKMLSSETYYVMYVQQPGSVFKIALCSLGLDLDLQATFRKDDFFRS